METKILIIKDENLEENLIEVANNIAKKLDATHITFVVSDEYTGYPTRQHVSRNKCCNVSINSFSLMDLAKINYKRRFVKAGSGKYKIVAACRHYKQFTKMAKSLKRSIIIKHLSV